VKPVLSNHSGQNKTIYTGSLLTKGKQKANNYHVEIHHCSKGKKIVIKSELCTGFTIYCHAELM